jgi:hypothetical protein
MHDVSVRWFGIKIDSTLVHRFAVSNTNIHITILGLFGISTESVFYGWRWRNNFRIVTSLSSWSDGITTPFRIEPSGTIIVTLPNIAPGENFPVSRLEIDSVVTFEQIDPLLLSTYRLNLQKFSENSKYQGTQHTYIHMMRTVLSVSGMIQSLIFMEEYKTDDSR